jgi:hypothetical protein
MQFLSQKGCTRKICRGSHFDDSLMFVGLTAAIHVPHCCHEDPRGKEEEISQKASSPITSTGPCETLGMCNFFQELQLDVGASV